MTTIDNLSQAGISESYHSYHPALIFSWFHLKMLGSPETVRSIYVGLTQHHVPSISRQGWVHSSSRTVCGWMNGVIASVTELLAALCLQAWRRWSGPTIIEATQYIKAAITLAPQRQILPTYGDVPSTPTLTNTSRDLSWSRLYSRGGFDNRLVPFMFHNIILMPNGIAPSPVFATLRHSWGLKLNQLEVLNQDIEQT